MFVMPAGPFVIGSACAVSRATSVSVSVTIAKYTPRKRKIGSPMPALATAQNKPAKGSVHQNSISYLTTSIAET